MTFSNPRKHHALGNLTAAVVVPIIAAAAAAAAAVATPIVVAPTPVVVATVVSTATAVSTAAAAAAAIPVSLGLSPAARHVFGAVLPLAVVVHFFVLNLVALAQAVAVFDHRDMAEDVLAAVKGLDEPEAPGVPLAGLALEALAASTAAAATTTTPAAAAFTAAAATATAGARAAARLPAEKGRGAA